MLNCVIGLIKKRFLLAVAFKLYNIFLHLCPYLVCYQENVVLSRKYEKTPYTS